MGEKRIDQLVDEAATLDDTDLFVLQVLGGSTKKIPAATTRAQLVTSGAAEAAGAVMDSDFAGSHTGGLKRTGAGTYAVRKDNLAAVGAPTINDDTTQGYEVGSRWVVPGAAEYSCLDASTAAAVWVLVASAAAAASDVLWQWNRTDTSQFDTGAPIVHQRDLGGASGSVTMTYVADAWQGEPVLRLAGTVQGGHVIPVLASEITLPERYVIEVRLRRVSVSSVPALCAMFFHESSGVVNGLYFSRGTGSSAGAFSGVKADLQTVSTAGGSFASWNATAEAHGGGVYRCEVWRQAGANPARLAVRVTGEEPTATGRGAFNEATATLTDWDGLDMGRLGLGIYCGGSATAGEADFLDLRVLRHPLDR